MVVIDSDPARLTGVVAGLTSAGFVVFAASRTGRGMASALLIPDAIVLGAGLLDADCQHVTACVRDDPRTARIPIIVLPVRGGDVVATLAQVLQRPSVA